MSNYILSQELYLKSSNSFGRYEKPEEESNVYVQWLPSYPRRTPNFAYVAWQVASNPLFTDSGFMNVPEQATAYPLCQYYVEHHNSTEGEKIIINVFDVKIQEAN